MVDWRDREKWKWGFSREFVPRPKVWEKRELTYQEFVRVMSKIAGGMPISSRELMEITGFLWRYRDKLGIIRYLAEQAKQIVER